VIRRIRFSLATTIALLLMMSAATAATITVNGTGDDVANDGTCTLREAIVAASSNSASGDAGGECVAGDPLPIVDTIAFAIPGAGVQTIQPLATMPVIQEAVVIDGYTQAGASPNTLAIGDDAVLLIEIDGSLMPPNSDLLDLPSGGSTIRGLVINRVQGTSIFCGFSTFASNDNVIEGNFLGTDPSGTSYLGFAYTSVRADGANNTIGGTTPAARNVFATTGGTNSGTVMVQGDGDVVQGNYVGVDAAGSASLQPASGGTNGLEIGLAGTALNTLIGGDSPGAGNVIFAGNVSINIHPNGSANVTVQGNRIGTDAAGSAAIGVGNLGINVDGVGGVLIGGPTSGAGNLIAGHSQPINVGGGASGVVIQGNLIGTDASGTRALLNYGNGITLATPGVNSTIGGTAPGEGNTIAYSCGQGIAFNGPDHWPILGNSIYSNGGLGISLSGNGAPVPNDPGDADTGANDLQNYPVITAASVDNGSATLAGTLNSTSATTFRIEFFSNVGCDASGFGEGRTFIGTTDVTTDIDGNASFGPSSFAVPAGETEITATATDPDGNTSEFAQCAGPHDHMFANGFELTCTGSG
jgi:CSLREA domain-containing protein